MGSPKPRPRRPSLILDGLCLHALSSFQRTGLLRDQRSAPQASPILPAPHGGSVLRGTFLGYYNGPSPSTPTRSAIKTRSARSVQVRRLPTPVGEPVRAVRSLVRGKKIAPELPGATGRRCRAPHAFRRSGPGGTRLDRLSIIARGAGSQTLSNGLLRQRFDCCTHHQHPRRGYLRASLPHIRPANKHAMSGWYSIARRNASARPWKSANRSRTLPLSEAMECRSTHPQSASDRTLTR